MQLGGAGIRTDDLPNLAASIAGLMLLGLDNDMASNDLMS